ncbi:MAG: FumA C-terminus/TtdB family hydratase beta subunit [Bacilli bacterium]|nr:FumA C-terminus/TtdB family hydratase beta subunit [Bacilli bacterium]
MKIIAPLKDSEYLNLKIGDEVLINGTIYTARDAAHKKLIEDINENIKLPFSLADSIIYYTGPTPTPVNMPIGSAGPTSSYRMDTYAIELMKLGQKIMIGKGPRSAEFKKELKKNKAVYLGAIGGAGALISTCIKSSKIIAYNELQSEAIHELIVKDFPAIVIYDSNGNDLIEQETTKYKNLLK